MSRNTPYIHFGEFDGINNVNDPLELSPSEVVKAKNADIDNRKRLRRRRGYAPTAATGNIHSLWSIGKICLFVEGTELKRLNQDYSKTTLRIGLTAGLRMSYEDINGIVYYSNGNEIGFTDGYTDNSFPMPTESFKSPMVAGNLLAYHNGRLYAAKGNITLLKAVSDGLFVAGEGIIWYSDPMAFGRTDLRKNFIQISWNNTYFMAGRNPDEFVLIRKADYNAIPYTAITIEGGLAGEVFISGNVVMWASERGICLGGDGGQFINLSIKRYVMPSARAGASIYRINNNGASQFVTILHN